MSLSLKLFPSENPARPSALLRSPRYRRASSTCTGTMSMPDQGCLNANFSSFMILHYESELYEFISSRYRGLSPSYMTAGLEKGNAIFFRLCLYRPRSLDETKQNPGFSVSTFTLSPAKVLVVIL